MNDNSYDEEVKYKSKYKKLKRKYMSVFREYEELTRNYLLLRKRYRWVVEENNLLKDNDTTNNLG
jgi:hypothetical protein